MLKIHTFKIQNYYLLLLPLLISGCHAPSFTHTTNFNQGNILTPRSAQSIHSRINKTTLARTIGQPVLINPLQDNTWHYLFNQVKRYKVTERRLWIFYPQ